MSQLVRRRWWAFSLRELLLLMLTVGAIAGWWRNLPILSRVYKGNRSALTEDSKFFTEIVRSAERKVNLNRNGNLQYDLNESSFGSDNNGDHERLTFYGKAYGLNKATAKDNADEFAEFRHVLLEEFMKAVSKVSVLETSLRLDRELERDPSIEMEWHSIDEDKRVFTKNVLYFDGNMHGHILFKFTEVRAASSSIRDNEYPFVLEFSVLERGTHAVAPADLKSFPKFRIKKQDSRQP